jgi:hypothetical protein
MRACSICAVAAIAVLSFVAFGPICNSYFVSDDSETLIATDKIVSAPGLFLDFFVSSGLDPHRVYRPLPYALLSFTYLLGGTDPFTYHLISILMHIAVSCLIYLLVLRLLSHAGGEAAIVAFLAAALFAVHPVHHEPVIWISAVAYPLLALFCLVSLIAYAGYDRDGNKACLLLSLASFICALGTSEPSISLPVIIALYQLIYGGEPRAGRERRWRGIGAVAPHFIVLGVYFMSRRYIFGTAEITHDGYDTRVFAIENVLNDFVRLFNPLSNPRRYYLFHAWRPALLTPAIVLAGLSIAFFKKRAPIVRLILFSLLWSATSAAALYVNFGAAAFPPRFFYLASIGLCIAVAASADAIIFSWRSLRWRTAVYAGVACVMVALCVAGLSSYVDDWAQCSRISSSISKQLGALFLDLEPGENCVILNTQYNVWAASVYNRRGPKFFMDPPLYPRRCSERVIALNVRQFPADLGRLRSVRASGAPARYYCWCETSMKLVELPFQFIDDVIRNGELDTRQMVERYCHRQ